MPRGWGKKGGQRHHCGTGSFQLESLGERENFWGQQVQHHQHHPSSISWALTVARHQAASLTDTHSLKHYKPYGTGVTFPHPCFHG